MGIDHEPQEKPFAENTTPPFLTQEQLQQVQDTFSYDNFNIVNPPEGKPYLVITVPDQAQDLVNHAFDKANQAYLEQMRNLGRGITEAVPKDEQKKAGEILSGLNQPFLKFTHAVYIGGTLANILLAAQSGAQINALTAFSKMPDSKDKEIAYQELVKKQDRIRPFLNSESARYILYSGPRIIHRVPADLENPYAPTYTARQN